MIPVLLWALGILFFLGSSILSLGRLVPENPGDMRFNAYVLEHTYRWVRQLPGHESFWDPPIFYPQTNTLAYSDTLLGTAPIYWLPRLFSVRPEISFLLWIGILLSLNYGVFYFWAKDAFKLKPLAAALGAFMLALS